MPERNRVRDSNGQFMRTRESWTEERWDDGYIDSRGRFRVYRSDCPRAYKDGYALRAHVVWWLSKGRAHPRSSALHHKDHNTLNDKLENLVVLNLSQHQSIHRENWVTLTCQRCHKSFLQHAWRIRERWRTRERTVRYCSRQCRDAGPRPERKKRTTLTCSHCRKFFEVKRHQAHTRRFCSNSCAAKWKWESR